ncbi:hypothetical protein ACFOPX_00905 [Helicobacter baculiformis]|uniref:Inner membrane protein n=1 Tax=Helicobacter baculiformis TaxID=427351 RepID=A0ABV7ZIM2_9HELI|nr:hypothetical protein [Helicobacter baculiformis]
MLKTRFSATLILAWLGFYLYSNLRDIYAWLPPMLGFLFALYRHTLMQERPSARLLICIFACLASVELIHTEPLGVLILLFTLYEKFIVQRLLRAFQETFFGDLAHAFCIYTLYFMFLAMFHHNYTIIWGDVLSYSVLEFLLWRVYARA